MNSPAIRAWWLLMATFIFVTTTFRLARAVDHTTAGSAQVDYHLAGSKGFGNPASGNSDVFDGFTIEASFKMAVDVSEHLSANVKVCFGCHGLEADMAYFDLRAADEFNLRVGRFSPSFGSFNVRHDPANHKLSDKPLPYDMGRMLRKNAWNNGVLPAPFPDVGIELSGTHWFGETAQFDYAAYTVSGFRNSGANPTDLNFQESHLPYYVDNNARPAIGTRIALTFKLGAMADTTVGGSAMTGTYDHRNDLTYFIGGADLSLRVERTTIRIEYLLRRQEFDASNPALFKYDISPRQGDFFAKHGAFIELEHPLARRLDAVWRADAMFRTGNVLASSELSDGSSVLRATFGLALAVERNLRLKCSAELWQFSDPDARGRQTEISAHWGAVGTF
ncbi:MAG TPA: hypothetical protein VK550_36515 [Polyangiaceae bacterium]|nr:hypothetical protein [Polyangiaceae bacterium]